MKSKFMAAKPDIHHISQVARLTPTGMSRVVSLYPWYDVMKMVLYLFGVFLPKTYNPNLLIPIEGHSAKYSTNAVKVIKNKQSLKTVSVKGA